MPRSPYKQQRLFAPLGMMRQPHQMSPTQFANSPRTMIHGSDEEDFEDLRMEQPQSQGFHVGTPAAADERLGTRHMSAVEGFYHPVRLPDRRDMTNTPTTPIPDQGDDWHEIDELNVYYRNEYEDKGSISAVMHEPSDVEHYADFVHAALDRGGIPSGAAEHFATQLDSPEREHSPGIPRGLMRVERDEYETGSPPEGRSRMEHREDLYDSPVTQFQRGIGGTPTDQTPSMFNEAQSYDEQGWPTTTQLVPKPGLVPPENRAAVAAQEEERRKPWLRRLQREQLAEEALKYASPSE